MTSKISFFKLVKEDLRRRSWLFAITALVLFVAQPVALMLTLSNWMENVELHYTTMDQVVEFYTGQMGFDAWALVIIMMVVAIVSAFTGYQYLHSKVKLDFFHSLSVKRYRLFFVQYVSGVLIYLIPSFVCMILALAVGGVNGILSASIAVLAVKAFVIHILYYVVIYGTAILAMMMTGKIVVAFLALATFMCYGPALNALFNGLIYKFFNTAMSGSDGLSGIGIYLSPMSMCFVTEGKLNETVSSVGEKWVCVGGLLLFAIVITALGLLLYNLRKTEAAEHSIAFSKAEGTIKFLLTVPISIGVGFYLSFMMSKNSFVWFLGGAVAGILISSALIEFIYHMDIREVFRHKLQILLAAAAAIAVILGFRYDVTGYDTYIPDMDDISEMAIQYEPINGSYSYKTVATGNGSSSYFGEQYGLEESAVKNFEPIYRLAEEGIKWVQDEERQEQERISVRYVLKSGRSVYRTYYVPEQMVNEQMQKLYDSVEFKEAIYPVLRETGRSARYISLTGWDGGVSLNLTSLQRGELLQAYQGDLKNITYEELQKDQQIAILSVEFADGNGDTTGMEEKYPVTLSSKNTLALLKEYGYEVPMEPDPEKIDSIEVEAPNIDTQKTAQITIKDKKEIEEILKSVKFSCFLDFNSLGSEKEENCYLSITYDNNSYSLWGSFLKGKVPEFVKERLKSSGTEENPSEREAVREAEEVVSVP